VHHHQTTLDGRGCSQGHDRALVDHWAAPGHPFDGSQRSLTREDPDMFQRFIAEVEPNRIAGRWEASEDHGSTWRKDFDLIFERA
jgi:hypothetical protein